MMRSLNVERLYHDLARRLGELPAGRQAAFHEDLTAMTQSNEGPVSDALREAIAKSNRTPCSIAREAGIDPAPMYRFLARTAQLKLSSVDALCRVLSLEVTAAKRSKTKPASAEQTDEEFTRELERMVNRSLNAASKRPRKAAKRSKAG